MPTSALSKKSKNVVVDGVIYRPCSDCNEYKTLDNFHLCNSKWKSKPFYMAYCKPCQNNRTKATLRKMKQRTLKQREELKARCHPDQSVR